MSRVVIVQDYVPAYREAFFESLADRAAGAGIDVVVATSGQASELAARGDAVALRGAVPVGRREYRVLGRRFVVRGLDEVISDADLVVLELARRNLDAYRLVLARRPPMIALWGHGRDYTTTAGTAARSLLAWLTRRADWFFAYTAGGAVAVERSGMPPERVTVTQNALETVGLRRRIDAVPADELHDFESRLGLTGRTAIFLGALDPSKRLELVFAAGDELARGSDDFRMLVAGDGPMRQFVEDRAESSPWMRILGRIDSNDKALALAASRALVMPGRVGLVAVESFAAGVPIVTTSWRLHAPEFEYLQSGVNAIVTPDEPGAYAAGVRSVLDDDALHDRLAAECRRSAVVYTLDAMVTGFLAGMVAALKAGPR